MQHAPELRRGVFDLNSQERMDLLRELEAVLALIAGNRQPSLGETHRLNAARLRALTEYRVMLDIVLTDLGMGGSEDGG